MRLLADENLNNHIFRSLLLQRKGLDLIRIQDTELSGKDDEVIMDWAIQENRLLLTHDVRTIPAIAIEWINQGKQIPGIFLIEQYAPIGKVIEDLLLIIDASEQREWEGHLYYLPF